MQRVSHGPVDRSLIGGAQSLPGFRFLVALRPERDLSLCAKYLFIAAINRSARNCAALKEGFPTASSLCPGGETCCFAPKICSLPPWLAVLPLPGRDPY